MSKTEKKASGSYHHGDLKASLLVAANVILHRDGADALSLRAIAAEVGVSHMAPYSHFKNKKELVQAVAESGFNQMADAMTEMTRHLDHKNPGEFILAYGASYIEFATQNPQLYRLMLGQVETQGRKVKKETTVLAAPQASGPTELISSSKRPFILLREAFAKLGGDENHIMAQAMGAWSMVHGMAALILEGHIQVPQGTSIKQFLAAATLQR